MSYVCLFCLFYVVLSGYSLSIMTLSSINECNVYSNKVERLSIKFKTNITISILMKNKK